MKLKSCLLFQATVCVVSGRIGHLCIKVIQTPVMAIKNHFVRSSFYLFLLSFFNFFFLSIDIDIALWTTRPLSNDIERRTQGSPLLLTILSMFVLPWLTFAFCFIAPLFLGRSNGMTTDIGSLAAGLDPHVAILGIGRKGLFHCRLCSHWRAKHHSPFVY
jgi:hypothetical protein